MTISAELNTAQINFSSVEDVCSAYGLVWETALLSSIRTCGRCHIPGTECHLISSRDRATFVALSAYRDCCQRLKSATVTFCIFLHFYPSWALLHTCKSLFCAASSWSTLVTVFVRAQQRIVLSSLQWILVRIKEETYGLRDKMLTQRYTSFIKCVAWEVLVSPTVLNHFWMEMFCIVPWWEIVYSYAFTSSCQMWKIQRPW